MVKCDICPHGCNLSEGVYGVCGVRVGRAGEIVNEAYGMVTSAALDPIEKKPLARYYSGTNIFSIGSYGCNMRCDFCQNWQISKSKQARDYAKYHSPQDIVDTAINLRSQNNVGIAYTYNEPLVNYEYVYDCAKLANEADLKNILVTNGFVNVNPFRKLLKYIDAANIDLKGFTPEFYKKLGGDLDTVKGSIQLAHSMGVHLEVTTLVIDGLNSSEVEIENQCRWLASINKEIPLHLSRFFPQYQMTDRPPTPISVMKKLEIIANKYLDYVYLGNV